MGSPHTSQEILDQAKARHAAGDLAAAEPLYRRLLETDPGNPQALHLLGVLAHQTGRIGEALERMERAVAVRPDYPEALNDLGNALLDAGRPEEAAGRYRQALALRPGYAPAWYNLGNAERASGRLEEAAASYRKALFCHPGYAEACVNLGATLLDLNRPGDAEASFLKALALRPDFPEAENNLGNAYRELQRYDEAMERFRRALALRPDYADAHFNLAFGLKKQDQLDAAIDHYRRAVALDPGLADGWKNLGICLAEAGLLEESLDCFAKACQIGPDSAGALSNLLLTEQYRPGHTAESLYRLHCRWEERFASRIRPARPARTNTADPDRPLRVGFVSPDLGRHPVGYFVVGLMENMPGEEIRTFVYSDRPPDDLTERIMAATDVWRDTREMPDNDLLAAILADKIDILVDLAGHSGSRLLVFAARAAPLQVTWAGYVGTTGLTAMDYILTDIHSTPQADEPHYSEKVVRMPNGWLCYDPPDYAPDVGPPPFRENGHITFASFSNPAKINRPVVALWAKILKGCPRSRLFIKGKGGQSETLSDHLRGLFEAEGVHPSRLLLEGRSPHADLLACYNRVDIALDTFPYSGGLTTYEALWMGVPVITVPGDTFAGRHALSHLTTLGLPELAAADRDDYAALALALAGDGDRLEELRKTLRPRMAHSPICDRHAFARDFADVMRRIWREHCQRLSTNVDQPSMQ